MESYNNTTLLDLEGITKDDAAWILSNAFLILTMQTGFGMLEAGSVSSKNVANIMIKNVVDVSVGGITYWILGYALSFGKPSNQFFGYGNFFFSEDDTRRMGSAYTHYVFQFSFATAATTIVSGAVAERMKLSAYMLFSAINTIIYCLPASWAWNDTGFLKQLKFFDFAGACVVHLTGGASALIAAIMLGPRLGRFTEGPSNNYDKDQQQTSTMSSPVTALTGTFMLWWAWLAFNCGSTFGIADHLWKIAAKVGVTTLNGSIGGSLAGLFLSVVLNWNSIYFDIPYIITSVLGGLISVTASCAVISPVEAVLIGAIGGALSIGALPLLVFLKIDDPVGAVPVHFTAAIWSVLAVGLFGKDEFGQLGGLNGLFHGGGFYLLGIQAVGAVIMAAWSMTATLIVFVCMKFTIGIRMSPEEEILGADWVEHRVRSENFAMKLEKALSSLNIDHKEEDEVAFKVLREITKARKNDRRNTMKNVDYYIRNVAGSSVPGPKKIPNELEDLENYETEQRRSKGDCSNQQEAGSVRMYQSFTSKQAKKLRRASKQDDEHVLTDSSSRASTAKSTSSFKRNIKVGTT